MDILLLTTPVQHADNNPNVIKQPKTLQAWCDALPTMNVIATVDLLKQALLPFNELKLNSTERFKLLEIYRNSFEAILSSYDELRLRTLPISPEKRKAIAEDIMWLYLDLANGYKIIIKEAHDSTAYIKNNNEIIISIYRAMELIITSLLYATKAHENPPQLVILEIKQLFLLAESQSLIETKIKTIKDRLSPATIENLFKQFILFSSLQLNVFASEDILEFFTLIDNYTTQISFISPEQLTDRPYIYSIDFTDDNLPKVFNLTNESNLSSVRLIDISQTISTMQAIINQKNIQKQSFIENKENKLLKMYINSLTPAKTGDSGQPQIVRSLKLAKGIETVHYFLEHLNDVNELFKSEISDGIEIQSINFDEEIINNISDWTLKEETDTARVLVTEPDNVKVKLEINDFVALIQQTGSNQAPVFITGVIRKIREEDEHQIKIGIQVLPGHPLPVRYIHKNGKEYSGSGLYFPPITALKKPASLLITRNNFKNDMNCFININKQEFSVQPTNKILETDDITQFNFSTLN